MEGDWKVIGRSLGHTTEMTLLSEVESTFLALRATSWLSEEFYIIINDTHLCEDAYQVNQFSVISNSDLRLDKIDF